MTFVPRLKTVDFLIWEDRACGCYSLFVVAEWLGVLQGEAGLNEDVVLATYSSK